jgi:thiol:disulfide interchange protein DsbA
VDTVHEPIFKAIHEERRPLRDENALARFVADLGVDEAKFRQAFNSFEVHTLLRRSAQLSAAYQVRGVPAMIVDGRYSTSASLAGGHPEVLQVVDYLVEQRRSAG